MMGSYYDHRSQVKSSDQCATSSTIDGTFTCNGTYNTIQMANVSNMISQTAGSAATMMMGQQAQARAMQAGTQEEALRSAGTTQVTTGTMQMGMGGLNAAVGALQIMQAMKHEKQAQRITREGSQGISVVGTSEGDTSGSQITHETDAGWVKGTGMSQNIIRNFKVNEESGIGVQAVDQASANKAAELAARESQGKQLQSIMTGRVQEIAGHAASEQRQVHGAAMAGGMMSIMTGGQQMMMGGMQAMAGKQLQAAADKLKNQQGNKMPPIMTPSLPNNISAGGQVARTPSAITGSGTDVNADSSEATTELGGGPPEMGSGFNPNPLPSGLSGAPPPGKFTVGGGGSTGTGAGGGNVGGGGNTSAAQGTPEDPQAKLASPNNGDAYAPGGGGSLTSGGGAGKGAEGGPDLSSLLGSLLPKKEEANQPANSILEFGAGNDPNQPMSALDKSANLFVEVSKTYHDRASHGAVGF
jgi:hypothetical protein